MEEYENQLDQCEFDREIEFEQDDDENSTKFDEDENRIFTSTQFDNEFQQKSQQIMKSQQGRYIDSFAYPDKLYMRTAKKRPNWDDVDYIKFDEMKLGDHREQQSILLSPLLRLPDLS